MWVWFISTRLGRALAATGAALALLAGAYLSGRRKGAQGAAQRETRRRLDAMKEKQRIDRDAETQDDISLIDRISR